MLPGASDEEWTPVIPQVEPIEHRIDTNGHGESPRVYLQ
jgi:hypothetical protein